MAPLLAEVEPGQVPGGGGEDAAGDTEGGHQEADTGSFMVNKTFQFDVFLETYKWSCFKSHPSHVAMHDKEHERDKTCDKDTLTVSCLLVSALELWSPQRSRLDWRDTRHTCSVLQPVCNV